jgi:endonuclease-3 related protein
MFRLLEAAMGTQNWWPAESAFEVVVGAYLTQNTAWTNVAQAMANLRAADALSISGIRTIELKELEGLVRPAGYFRQKASRLKLFVAHLDGNYAGSLDAMFQRPVELLRQELLGLTGIGPETADSILLYAANREVFVVDTYTRRIFERHGLTGSDTGYEEIRLGVQAALAEEDSHSHGAAECELLQPAPAQASASLKVLPHEPSAASKTERSDLAQRYNEFHALIVQTAKHFCVKGTPKCDGCPLREMLDK